MVDKKSVALQWINAWNNHDLNSIVELYDNAIEHTSPKIANYFHLPNNTINDKDLLKQYFSKALIANPELHFQLQHIFIGENSCIMVYNRNKDQLVAEYLEFNAYGKIIKSNAHPVSS